MTHPNILLIHADQHRFDCVGVNGHPLVQTPNIDRLAAEGINFTQAYTPTPVCVPARNSLMHGTWATRHLSIANWDTEAPRPPETGLPTFSRVLRDAGYTLGCVGKWQVHPTRSPLDYEFHTYVDEKDYDTWRATQGFPPHPRPDRWFGALDPHVTPEDSRLGWGATHVIRQLENAVQNSQPFFMRWDPGEPHLPHIVPEPYFSMYPPENIAPWPSYPDPLEGKPYIQAQQRRTWKLDNWTWADWSQVVSRYLGQISLLDAQLGRVLATLDRLGLAENTLVVYTTDHGGLCGGHGMIDKHYVMYDDVVRVPLVARWPGQIAAGNVCDAFVTHGLDLAATFCDLAGATLPETFQGQSLAPLFYGAQDNGRDSIFAMYFGNQFGLYSQRMVRDRRWKYVWNATAEDELYDLVTDPGEVTNLATDLACRSELVRLRHRIVAWIESTHDPLLNGWTRAQLLENVKI